MKEKIMPDVINNERKKFIHELIQNSIISKDQLRTEQLENDLTKIFLEVESIIKNTDINNVSQVYYTIIDYFFTKIDLIVKNTPGLTIGVKDVISNGELCIYYGKTSDKINAKKIDEDTRFDLASVSKLFTAISVLKCSEKGKLKLQDPVHKYNNKFVNLKNISIEDTAKFYYQINTDGRLDVVDSREQLLSNLYNSTVVKSNTQVYSDIPYIILGEVLNSVGNPFEDIFHKELGLIRTDYDTQNATITGGNYDSLNSIHDKKAQRMIDYGFEKPGHAGIYGTSEDLNKLGSALLREGFLTEESKKILTTPAQNERQFEKEGKLVNRNRGMGVYIQTEKGITESDIAIQASKDTYATSGTTGPYMLIDPLNKFTFNYCCNPYSKEGGCVPIMVNGQQKRWSGVSNIIKTELVYLVYELRFAYNIYRNIAITLDDANLAQEVENVFGSKHVVRK